MNPLGLYIHIPFCPHKCGYCAFNSYPAMAHLHADFVEALERDLQEAAARHPEIAGRPVATVFVGGGTPTLLETPRLARVLRAVGRSFLLTPDAEFTMEANPGTVTTEKLAAAKAEGVNRVSFGAQSFDPAELRALERVHGPEEIGAAISAARAAGFDNVNVDLMFSLPGQSPERWRENLDRALALGTEHVSSYDLTIEEGTAFEAKVRSGAFRTQDEEIRRALYEEAVDRLAAAGLNRYEISNFARPGRECRHNLRYWRHEDYLGVGPGAHSFLGARRFSTVKKPADYIHRVQQGLDRTDEAETLTPDQLAVEAIYLGFRTGEGIDVDRFTRRYGFDPESKYRSQIDRWETKGLLARTGGRLRLTGEGLARADHIAASFAGP